MSPSLTRDLNIRTPERPVAEKGETTTPDFNDRHSEMARERRERKKQLRRPYHPLTLAKMRKKKNNSFALSHWKKKPS